MKPSYTALVLSLALASAYTPSIAQEASISGVTGITPIGRYVHNTTKDGAAEIVVFDKTTKRLFVVNAEDKRIDALDITDPTTPASANNIPQPNTISGFTAGSPNSVAVANGIVAIAWEADTKQDNGVISFHDSTTLNMTHSVSVGALPDMVTFTPDGKKVLVANEGEPNAEYTTDPEGTVSIIDISNGVDNASTKTVTFKDYNKDSLNENGVRIFGKDATAAQDLEPEYIAVSGDSKTAWVAMQENNALAEIDVDAGTVKGIYPLGTKDHSKAENSFDASNKDNGINIKTWSTMGMYQPDAITALTKGGKTYIFTANEGDARDYDGYSEETRVKDLTLDAAAFPTATDLQKDENLGRLKTTTANGDTDGDGDVDIIYSYGARSFSVWDASTLAAKNNSPVFDSGNQIETTISQDDTFKAIFNTADDENEQDNRSDDKGPEPEAITLGQVGDKHYAFVGLERIGGIMIYDVTDPTKPSFITYKNLRSVTTDQKTDGLLKTAGAVSVDLTATDAGDLGPEGIAFIPAADSPNGKALLAVANEVSNTTTIYTIDATEVESTVSSTTYGDIKVKANNGFLSDLKIENADSYTTGKPANTDFKFGVTSYKVTGLDKTTAQTVQITLTMPSAIPADSKVYKVTNSGYEEITGATISGQTIMFSITDGGTLDEDGTHNGTIVDPVAVGTSTSGGSGSLSAVGLFILGLLGLAYRFQRRQTNL